MALREYPQGSKILASSMASGKRSRSPTALVSSSAEEYTSVEKTDIRAGSRPIIRILGGKGVVWGRGGGEDRPE